MAQGGNTAGGSPSSTPRGSGGDNPYIDYDSDDSFCFKNFGISTDLVPTLLNMYDALYIRLKDDDPEKATPEEDVGDQHGNKSRAEELAKSCADLSRVESKGREPTTKENGESGAKNSRGGGDDRVTENGDRVKENGVLINQVRHPCTDRLSINEKDIDNANQLNNNIVGSNNSSEMCKKCEVSRTSNLCTCSSKASMTESITSLFEDIERRMDSETVSHYDNLDRRLRKEHIYAEPNIFPKQSPNKLSPKVPETPTSPPGFDPRRFKDVYRPLSSISSSSSSSSSSNSLPRRGVPVNMSAYLASAESLEDNDADHSDTEETTRRRDRTIKARREKAMRTGSGDSGVQCHSISLPAPPLAKPRYCDPNLAYMDRVVLEIIETEAVYVSNMKEVIEGYLEHWRPQAEAGISQQNVDDLFSNIEQIYRFNREFLLELEQCGVDPVDVARCFVRNNTGFVIYTQYCTYYPRTMSVLTELMRSEQAVRAFRERQVALGHTLPLGSYLLKPVQRILKYHLLLGNIVKHFDKDRAGYSEVVDALSSMTEMAHHINDMKRKHEHAVRVQEIQSLLYGWQGEDLTTYGELNAEGTFRMCGAKGLRHVFLFDKMILIAKKKEESFLMYKTHIMCSNLMLIESVPGEPLSFHIIPFDNPRLQYTLEARNLDQKREWTLLLKRVILENYSATIPEHARQLVMTLGQSKPEDIPETAKGTRRAHLAPEYLERRKERRRSEGVLNSRLRNIRRSSRARKDKEDKGSRSRSVSRNRETEDDEPDRKISTNSCPGITEKPKLKLSMWNRRRSEPGVGSQDSLPLSINTTVMSDNPDTPDSTPRDPPTPQLLHASQNGLPPQEVSVDGQSMSEYEEREDERNVPEAEDDDAEQTNENLEEVIRQMLQFKLQEQQLILSKHRRGMIRKKQLSCRYETSDTENEDGPPKNISELYGGVYGADMNSVAKEEEISDYVNFFFNNMDNQPTIHPESVGGSSSEGQSVYSSALSVNQVGDEKLYSVIKPSNPVRRSSSDLSFKKGSLKKSNYDNLLNIWSSIRGKSPEKRHSGVFSPARPGQPTSTFRDRPQLRRAQSFTGDNQNSDYYSSSSQLVNTPNTAPITSLNNKMGDVWLRDDNRENRERPVTIAFDHSHDERIKDLEQYLNHSRLSRGQDRFPYDTEDGYTDYSMTPHMSMDNIISVHPEHKIYKSTQKLTLRSVFRKITSPRATKSEPSGSVSGSVFNYSMDSELDQSGDKKASKMVYNMARQCSRTLKERVQQIRAEDGEKSPVIKSNSEPIYAIPLYKQQQYGQYYSNQGINSIGARLACTNETSDYAVPRIQKPKSELRPDSVLSSSSILTSSSSSSSNSNQDSRVIEGTEVSSMLKRQEGFDDSQEPSPCFDSDASGDSYYERSFDQLDNLARDDLFRDSAIYSDPDDIESPPSSLKQELRVISPIKAKSGSKISPRPSFKESLKNVPSSQITEISEENLSDPLDVSSDENTCKEAVNNNTSSHLPMKKVPPPVPAKPEVTKAYRKQCGSLIMQQLKNLEECSSPLKYNRDDQMSPTFDGMKSVGDRLKDLVIQTSVNSEAEDSTLRAVDKEDATSEWSIKSPKSPTLLTPIIKCPITLSPLNILSDSLSPIPSRSKSVPLKVSPRPSPHPSPVPFEVSSPVHNPKSSPNKSLEASPVSVHTNLADEEGDEEPRMPRGWVKHVIGKLQAESDV